MKPDKLINRSAYQNQISWAAADYQVVGRVEKVEQLLSLKQVRVLVFVFIFDRISIQIIANVIAKVCKPKTPWHRLIPAPLAFPAAIDVCQKLGGTLSMVG